MKVNLVVCFVLLSGLTVSSSFSQPYVAGTTYFRIQHYGTCGRMIGVDQSGYVQMSWTHSNSNGTARHVYSNIWDSQTSSFGFENGNQIDCWSRAGFVTQVVSGNGWCYPAFHGPRPCGTNIITAVCIDFLPRTGAYTCYYPYIQENVEFGNPKIALSTDGILHIVSTEFPDSTELMRIFYIRGTPIFDSDSFGLQIQFSNWNGNEILPLDTVETLSAEIACSPGTEQVAIAWMKHSDIYLTSSYDNGLDWEFPQNITQFIPCDTACYGLTHDWACCDRDTMRAIEDLSMLFDDDGWLHIAFTTIGHFRWTENGAENVDDHNKAQIWHWNNQTNTFRLIAESWMDSTTFGNRRLCSNPPHAMVERPSLSINHSSGNLYCSYVKYDTAQYSDAGILNADVFITMSMDNGRHWSVGTNVTNTVPAAPGAPRGSNANEQDATLADHVADNKLHLFYLFDNGCCLDPMGDLQSLCEMRYLPIPINEIPSFPLMPTRQMHVEWRDCADDATDNSQLPNKFDLSVYPNPFNSSTSIEYDVPQRMMIDLCIFDILGQKVATLQSGFVEAGRHTLTWQADKLSAGMYFLSLHSPLQTKTQKLLYLK